MNKFSKTLRDNWIFLLMVLPGTIWLILFFYIPVFGNVVAFKDYHMTGEGFVHSIINSRWVGLDNFKFLFSSKHCTLQPWIYFYRFGCVSRYRHYP